MKFLSDVDGVAADFVQRVLDVTGSPLRPEDITQWDVLGMLSVEQREDAIEAMSSPTFWASLEVLDGAKRGVDHLVGLGHELVWVTSPWDSCPGWDVARRGWLREHFGEHDVIITSAKHHVVGDVFIDDKPKHVVDWQKAHPDKRAFLYDAPHNRGTSLPRVTWDQMRRIW